MNRPNRRSRRIRHTVLAAALLCAGLTAHAGTGLRLSEAGYFSKPGLDVLAFSNVYDGNFSDAKIAGLELIHHGVRTATNGDVRLAPTPEQWDAAATLLERKVDPASGAVTTRMRFDAEDFEYSVRVAPRGDGVAIQVLLDRPLPQALAGKAGFNLEFLPSAYFGRAWLAMRKSAYERVSPHSHGRIASWASSIAALSAKRRRPSATLVASTGPSP